MSQSLSLKDAIYYVGVVSTGVGISVGLVLMIWRTWRYGNERSWENAYKALKEQYQIQEKREAELIADNTALKAAAEKCAQSEDAANKKYLRAAASLEEANAKLEEVREELGTLRRHSKLFGRLAGRKTPEDFDDSKGI
jgi:uncharacterized membrane protein YccC